MYSQNSNISVMLFPPFSSPIAAVDIFHCAFKSQLKIKLNQSSFWNLLIAAIIIV